MPFKVGDRVRRTGGDVGNGTYSKLIKTGDIVKITSISFDGFLRFFNEFSGWGSSDFELVTEEPQGNPTDKELAEEYRQKVKEMRSARKALKSRGYDLTYLGQKVQDFSNRRLEDYKFVKTVTTTKEI